MAKLRPSVDREPDYKTTRNDSALFPLTDDEKGQRGLKLAELDTEVSNLENYRRGQVHQLNNKIKEKRGAMQQLGEEIREGVSRTVRCDLKFFDKERIVARYDASSGEFLGEREMNDMDRQLLLDVRTKEKKASKDKPAKAAEVAK